MNAHGSPYTSGSPSSPDGHLAPRVNPLRRPSDRFEWWFRGVLTILLVVGLPAAAYSAGTTAYEASMRTVRAQTAERHQVTARVTEDVRREVNSVAKQPAQIRWTDAAGVVRTGAVLLKPGTSKGTAVRVWVDRNGTVTSSPTSTLNARTSGWFMGGAAAFGVAFGSYALWVGTRLLLDRRRFRQWEAEWERTEPLWSARFRR
ncbi:Rv1733c family protein [Streptomyces longwoodensis]|uniref:Rv1733c family protein n=1 Tax=Streptomyces longwoodensis TaxID=68231 RepID=UPI003F4C7E68